VRRPLRLRSLKNKLAIVFCGITALGMVAIWFYVVPQLQDKLYEQKRADLTRVARASVDPLARAVGSEVHAKTLDELVRAVADSSDARVTLYGVQRSRTQAPHVLYPVSDSAVEKQIDETTFLADRAARTKRDQTGYGRVNGHKVVQSAVPLVDHGRAEWVVMYSRSLTGVGETVDLIRRQLLFAGLIAGLLSVMGAYMVAGFVGRRVRRLERASRRVAAGQFVAPLPVDSEDELGQLTAAFNDMQLRLSRVDRARKEFVANASHELRTPLFSLGGFIELLEDEDLDEASRAELLSAMHGQVDRLQKLAVDLLDLSRLDAGSFELERDRVDLTELARMVAGEFAPAVRRGDADMQLKTHEGGVEVTCDRERVAQIMRILMDNAIRHTPKGTPVTISTSRRNGTAKVTVADGGPGLDDGSRSQVFDRFVTGDSQHGGAGLGLAIAKELAARMHGEIRLKSRPGRTAFTLELPANSDDDAS
jgi:signal transduction histidine kinase